MLADNIQHDDQVTVVLPADLITQIDELLGGEFTNREDFMTAAARHYVEYVQNQSDAGPAPASAGAGSDASTQDPLADQRANEENNDLGATIQPMSQDGDTPFSPPDDTGSDSDIDPTHQATDSNIDQHEVYDEGLAGAAEAEEPNAGNAVTGYDPVNDTRKQD